MHRLAICFVLASLTLAAPRPSAADAVADSVYDTVDSVESRNHDFCPGCSTEEHLVIVRGILVGHSTPSTGFFNFGRNVEMARRCLPLAAIAMSKPGKYQFAIG